MTTFPASTPYQLASSSPSLILLPLDTTTNSLGLGGVMMGVSSPDQPFSVHISISPHTSHLKGEIKSSRFSPPRFCISYD